MKGYLIITGVVFGLIVVLHVWRDVVEGPQLPRDSLTALAAALSIWAWWLLYRSLHRR